MKNKIISVVVLCIFFLLGFFIINQNKNPSEPPLINGGEMQSPPDKGDVGGYSNIKYVKIAGRLVKVDLALTPATRERGLSGRVSLKENEGMLFVFDKAENYTFWMKDMNFPIDIIWLDDNQNVIYIKKDARPELYPETYGPDENSKYVLEVVSGFSDKNNLQVGDRVLFTY